MNEVKTNKKPQMTDWEDIFVKYMSKMGPKYFIQ